MFVAGKVEAKAWLEGLNEAQSRAVTHGDGPLLIVAGAGTGKTRTLTARVADLIDRGVAPERLLLLTFTRRASHEMLTRAQRMVPQRAAAAVWGGTFHSVANRLLRANAHSVGISPSFTVMDQADAADLMNLIRSELGLSEKKKRFPKKDTLASIYSRTVNSRIRLRKILERHFPWCADDLEGIREIFDAYVDRKRAQNVLDYDDLLLYWHALLSAGEAGARIASRFEHVLVDEYQDTNSVQADILSSLRRDLPNITVVGDDAQAIYSFRAATVSNILDFPTTFPGTTIVKLEDNYRSSSPILTVSNRVIGQARRRHEKDLHSVRGEGRKPQLITCFDETHQSDAVCSRVLEQREQGVRLMHQAVLFRTGHHSAALEIELARRNIPFVKYGGLRFVEAAHVKDVVAMMRILDNPHDELAWFRVLQLLSGIGGATARRLMDDLRVTRRGDGGAPADPVSRLKDGEWQAPAPAAGELQALALAFTDCLDPSIASRPGAQVERLGVFFEPVVRRVYDSPAARLADVEQLAEIATAYRTRTAFITDLALEPPNATGDLAGPPLLDDDYLILSTIHSAKGCEWDVVHVIHAADGMIPSDMATGDEEEIEEERRLLYVALTRARDMLYVYWPLRYYHRRMGFGDAHNYAQLSRFMTDDVTAACDTIAELPEIPPTEEAELEAARPSVVSDLKALFSDEE